MTLASRTVTVPLTSGSYTRSMNVPTATTFSIANNGKGRTPMRLGTGVYGYSGSIAFDLTADMRNFMLDGDFFERDERFSITMCDGDGQITASRCAWSSASISGNADQLVTGSISFNSCNGYHEEVELKDANSRDYQADSSLQKYWQYGNDGVTSFTMSFTRSVTDVYMNETDLLTPSFLRVGALSADVNVTCWHDWKYHRTIHLGNKKITFNSSSYIKEKGYSVQGLEGNSLKTYTLSAIGLTSRSDLFDVD